MAFTATLLEPPTVSPSMQMSVLIRFYDDVTGFAIQKTIEFQDSDRLTVEQLVDRIRQEGERAKAAAGVKAFLDALVGQPGGTIAI